MVRSALSLLVKSNWADETKWEEWEDSASMHSMQSVDAPVAPVVASAPPPPETPAPFAPGAPDASHPSTPKKTRISLDPAEDPQLPGGVEAGANPRGVLFVMLKSRSVLVP